MLVTKEMLVPIDFNSRKYYGSQWGPTTVWLLSYALMGFQKNIPIDTHYKAWKSHDVFQYNS